MFLIFPKFDPFFKVTQGETLFRPVANQTFDFRTNERVAFLICKQTIIMKCPFHRPHAFGKAQ